MPKSENSISPESVTATPSLQPDARRLLPLASRIETSPSPNNRINSLIHNCFLTNLFFPRSYADVVLHYTPNSRDAKTLRPHYQIICERPHVSKWNLGSYQSHRGPLRPPALKAEQFCYFHQDASRGVRRPRACPRQTTTPADTAQNSNKLPSPQPANPRSATLAPKESKNTAHAARHG